MIKSVFLTLISLFHALLCFSECSAFAKCPSGYNYESSTCYKLHGHCVNWDVAKGTCRNEKAFLFTVNTDNQFHLAQRIISGAGSLCDESIWLGGRRRSSGVLEWENGGGGMNHRYFAAKQPDNLPGEDCVSIRRAFGNKLNDHHCDVQKKFICQTCHLIEHCKTVTCPTPERTTCSECNDNKLFYKKTHGDTQCEEMCSWQGKSRFCWPGTCTDDLTKNCRCSTGFRKETSHGKTLCQPTTKPEIGTCEMTVVNRNKDKARAPNSGSVTDCASKVDFYGNFQPITLDYEMQASYSVPTNFPAKPKFIKEENFGVTDMQIRLRHYAVNGLVEETTYDILNDTVPSEKVRSPVQLQGTIQNPYTLKDGDRLCLRYIANGGGYLKYYDIKHQSRVSRPIPYLKQTTEKETCYRYDSTSPRYCPLGNTCSMGPLVVSSRITRHPEVTVTLNDWYDPIPTHGNSSNSAKIISYEITVREVQASRASKSFVDYTSSVKDQHRYINNTNIHSLSLHLNTSIPKLFCIILSVRDGANNLREARRFVLVDMKSELTATSAPIRVNSASPTTQYKWQTHHAELCLVWTGHFINTNYSNNPLLNPIKPSPNNTISGVYEQLTGQIPVIGTQNIDGIVKFMYAWNLNNGTFTHDTEVPDFKKQQICLNKTLADGQAYSFRVTAIDIVNNTYAETINVNIDATAPHINNLGLVNEGYEGLFAYGDEDGDMSRIHLSFEALDPHSGLEEIQWSFGSSDASGNVVTGHMPVKTVQENCTSVDFCYKPVIGSSEQFKYHLMLNGSDIVNRSTHIGDHNRNYYFTVKVTNRAKLSNIEHLDIILDKSPPEVGVVYEGPAQGQDIDYTNDNTFQAHWHGFIDHESGIKMYRIGVATKCIESDKLNQQHNRSELIMFQELPWTETSLQVQTNHSGKMYVSVVAMNNAMESSPAVCSDGITRDTSAPQLRNVVLQDARWSESIVCHDRLPWLMHSAVSKVLLNHSKVCLDLCLNQTNNHELLEILRTTSLENNDTEVADFMCSVLPSYTSDTIMYVPNDHVVLSWDIEEDESQMQDYLIGFGNHPSEKSAPSILAYKSSNQKRYVRKAHQGLGSNFMFYIFVKAINKAGSENIATIGPVLIDETPPLVKDKPVVEIHGSMILIGWHNDSFYDQEQTEPINRIYFQFKMRKNEKSVTPLMEWTSESPKACTNHSFSGGCVTYPLYKIQRKDTAEGLEFFVSLYPYNNAGHSARSDSDPFKLPSKYAPGHATVLDIDPNSITTSNGKPIDIDSHTTEKTLCFSWKGFFHHQDVSYAFGVGTKKGQTDVIQYRNLNNSFCLKSAKLQYFVKYFAGIRASCSGGQSEAFSNGVVIVDEQTFLNAMTSHLDIKECNMVIVSKTFGTNDSVTESFNVEIGREYVLIGHGNQKLQIRSNAAIISHIKFNKWRLVPFTRLVKVNISVQGNSTDNITVTLGDCVQKTYLKSSDKVYANIVVDRSVSLNISFQTAVSMSCKYVQAIDCKDMVSSFETTDQNKPIIITDVPYKQERIYSILVKACVDSGCLKSIKSQDFYFETSKPSGSLQVASLSASRADNCYRVSLGWTGFTSKSGILFYEWALSDDNEAMHVLTSWMTIAKPLVRNQVSDCVRLPIPPHEGMLACIRAHTKANNVRTVCQRLTVMLETDFSANILFEFDYSSAVWNDIEKVLHSSSIGERASLLHQSEVDVACIKAEIVGALLHAADRHVTWYLMTSRHVPDNCDLDSDCILSQISSSGYVKLDQDRIQPRQRYYICGHSNATTKERESSTEILAELSLCSDGFVKDDTRPVGGYVNVVNHNGYITDTESVSVSWTGFQEDIDVAVMGYLNPVKYYMIGIGRRPDDDSIVTYKNVGQGPDTILSNLHLVNGDKFYASIRATNYAGLSTTVSTAELTVDTTAPVTGYIAFLEDNTDSNHVAYVRSGDISIRLVKFQDEESGIDYFHVGIGSHNNTYDVIPRLKQERAYVDFVTSEKALVDGTVYFILVQAVNRAGLVSAIISRKFIIDRTPPTGGHVMDGDLSCEEDIDFHTNTTHVSGHWHGFTDADSGVHSYKVGLGTRPYSTDVEDMVDVGLRTDITWQVMITPGQTYYMTVEVCNNAWLCRTVSSDGALLDNSAPIGGIVLVGSHGRHQHYLPQTSTIFTKWFGFEDPQSGLDHFESCIGSRPTLCDLYPFSNHLLSSSITKTALALHEDTDTYITVKAVNKVGMAALRSSKPFRIDTNPPDLIEKPKFIGTFTNKPGHLVHFERSIIQIRWMFKDDQSPIIRHTVSLLTHHEGHSPIENLELGSESNLTVNMDENQWLHNGDKYYASVTCCNAADLCTTALSDDIIIDATPPHMGGFKPPLLWENKHGKDGSIISSIRLTWYGFLDKESDIKTFYIKAGSRYGGGDLSNDTIAYPAIANETEQHHTIELTQPLSVNSKVFLSIWADNHAGLNSTVARVKVNAISRSVSQGVLEIEKHSCQAEYCTGDCTCAVVGKTCSVGKARQCNVIDLSHDFGYMYPNVNVITGQRKREETITASSCCLTAHWTIRNNSNKTILRYEWSMGITQENPGVGIFGKAEIPWKDAGTMTEVIHCLPHGRNLTHNSIYTVYVRAWFATDEYAVYRSQPILIDHTPPGVSKRNHIKDSDIACSRDFDYIDWMYTVTACWDSVFYDRESSISYYTVALGTMPLADDVQPTTSTDLRTNITLGNITLEHGVKYYFTVTAYNSVGLSTHDISDGFVVDMDTPISGTVFNTDRHYDTRYQSDDKSFSISWHGFIDHHSGIKSYLVALAESNHKNISLTNFTDIGLRTTHTFENILLQHNVSYVGLVKSVDAAGHESNIQTSTEKIIDTTKPIGIVCSGFEHLQSISETVTKDDFQVSFMTTMEHDKVYKVFGLVSETNSAVGTEMLIGRDRHTLYSTLNNNGTRHIDFMFVSPVSDQQNISVRLYEARGTSLNMTLYGCKSAASSEDLSVIVRQISKHRLVVDTMFIDPESQIYKVKVGAGTTTGGYQIQSLNPVATGSSHSIHTTVPHGTRVFVTAVATNHAGLSTTFRARPIIMDHTGPVIDTLHVVADQLDGNTDEHNTTTKQYVFRANWTVADSESGVKSCYCSFGLVEAATRQYMPADTVNTCHSGILTMEHGTQAFVRVICINNVELATENVSSARAAFAPPSSEDSQIWFVGQSSIDVTHDAVRPSITLPDGTIASLYSNCTCLRFEWSGFRDLTGIESYEYRVMQNETMVNTWKKTTGIKTAGSVCRMQNMRSGDVYKLQVRAVNGIEEKSIAASANVLVECNKPMLQEHGLVTHEEDGMLNINWERVFASHPYFNLTYYVIIGSRRGYSDIADISYTDTTSFAMAKHGLKEIFVSLTGYYPTGLSNSLGTNIRL